MEIEDVRGHVFVISGPSGVGKTSVVKRILELDQSIGRVVTCTTREIRTNEIDGVDYNFMSVDEFICRRNNNEFIEYSSVYGNYYGILLSSIFEKIKYNNDCVILVVNWEGFSKIKKIISKNLLGFFLLPPTMEELEYRIRNRSSESEENIKKRIDAANEDISHMGNFDIFIKNFNITETARDILKVVNLTRNM